MDFPRTMVGGVSLPRLIIGVNWFFGFSHTSLAKDRFITSYMNRERIADILTVFLNAGVDAIMMGDKTPVASEAIEEAQQRTGRKLLKIITPLFNIRPGGPEDMEPERVFERCKSLDATFCFPHQHVTDALVDRRDHIIRDIDRYTTMIRNNGMIPGLSTHMPETIRYADRQSADVESYIQIYNAAGFLMQVEVDWAMRVISSAKKPVMVIKPLAAGKLTPPVGLAFVWNTIRPQDMVVVGTMSPDEASEVIELSLSFLSHQLPKTELQMTRSKKALQ